MGRVVILMIVLAAGMGLSAAEGLVDITMRKRGNVRYGPSTKASVIVTMEPGSVVQVTRRAAPKWLEIVFPEKGHAWMHEKVLEATAEQTILSVVTDGARVRADSRVGAELVAQLDLGTKVKWKGAVIDGQWSGIKKGAWYAVYPVGAVAYVHESVLRMTPDIVAQLNGQVIEVGSAGGAMVADASGVQRPRSRSIEAVWQEAQKRYEHYHQVLMTKDHAQAFQLNWQGLSAVLQQVQDKHRKFHSKLLAMKLQKAVDKIIAVAAPYQERHNITVIDWLPGHEPYAPAPVQAAAKPAAPVPAPAAPAPAPTAPQPAAPAPVVAPAPQPVPATPAPTAPAPQPAAPAPTPAAVDTAALEAATQGMEAPTSGTYVASGWLMQQDLTGVNAKHVLTNEDGDIMAVVDVAPGTSVSLAEFFWRSVGVNGESEIAEITVNGQTMKVPFVHITTIRQTNN